jgi:uncharacterized protein (TIGR00369 family)
MTKMGPAEIHAFLDEISPGANDSFRVEEVGERTARVRMSSAWLRPGGIVGGPSLMSLADYAVWVAVLAQIGPEPMTVTVSLNIHFLRPIPPGDVVAHARLHKLGKRLAVGDVLMYADGDDEPAAQATVTYSIPPA